MDDPVTPIRAQQLTNWLIIMSREEYHLHVPLSLAFYMGGEWAFFAQNLLARNQPLLPSVLPSVRTSLGAWNTWVAANVFNGDITLPTDVYDDVRRAFLEADINQLATQVAEQP